MSVTLINLAALALAIVATWLLTAILVRHLRARGLVDTPDERRQNHAPTPRGAGIAFVLVWLASTTIVLWPAIPVFLIAALVIASVGFWDDVLDAPVVVRLLVQLGAAVAAVAFLDLGHAALVTLGVVFVVASTNAFNFMDGSNGLAATQGVFSAGALGVGLMLGGAPELALAAGLLAAVLLGFLPHNFPQARAFMGDVGSTFLGFAVATLGLAGVAAGALNPEFVLLSIAPFLADTGLTLVRRIRDGERWYTAHRRHSYQRLIDSGWSHGGVVAGLAAVNLALIAPAMAMTFTGMISQGVVAVVMFPILTAIWWWSRHGE